MLKQIIPAVSICANAGDRAEWDICAYLGHMRHTHDASRFDMASDVDADDFQISVKSGRFSLFSGKIAHEQGLVTKEDHMAYYFEHTHSNLWCYVCKDNTAFFMNANEFAAFVNAFCFLEADSAKNKGYMKLRLGRQNKKYRAWLESHCGE